jgi:hypothetical protein
MARMIKAKENMAIRCDRHVEGLTFMLDWCTF